MVQSSDMTLERFDFARRRGSSAVGDSTSSSGSSQTPLLESSQSVSSQTASSQPKRRRYNVKWGEGRKWLQYDDVESVMACYVCRQYN